MVIDIFHHSLVQLRGRSEKKDIVHGIVPVRSYLVRGETLLNQEAAHSGPLAHIGLLLVGVVHLFKSFQKVV
jgi:hypothetical protein